MINATLKRREQARALAYIYVKYIIYINNIYVCVKTLSLRDMCACICGRACDMYVCIYMMFIHIHIYAHANNHKLNTTNFM